MIRILAFAALLMPAAAALSPPPPEPCELLGMGDVRTYIPNANMVIGSGPGEVSDCSWYADPNGTTIGAVLTREDKFAGEGTTAVAFFDAMLANPNLGPMTVVAGIGDRAAIQESEGEDARFVYVAASGDFLILTIIYLPPETALEIAKLAARRM